MGSQPVREEAMQQITINLNVLTLDRLFGGARAFVDNSRAEKTYLVRAVPGEGNVPSCAGSGRTEVCARVHAREHDWSHRPLHKTVRPTVATGLHRL